MPAIIGLFAFAQGLELSEGEATATISGVKKLSWNLWPKLSEILHVKWSLVRGWVIGLIMGVIPAAGGSVAQWIAYAEEIRRAKPGDQFGKGEVKGLAATEGSNNGVTGTSLVPMFVLGIPGGISAAVILGALMIHGLQPGMRLFKNSPEIIYTIMWGFIFANAIMGFIAVFLARTMAYLTLFPRGLIGPLILIFSVIGVYAGSNNVYDIWIMFGFGLLGYFMNKHRFSPAGTLLGLILGPIAEAGFRDTIIVSHGSPVSFVLTRPISVGLLVGIGLALYFSLRPKPWEKELEQKPQSSDG
jgi:putative tricarboxylic transport membrane protein